MTNENDPNDTKRNGRRSTDDSKNEVGIPSPSSRFRTGLFTWFVAVGGITALLGIGRASHSLDSAIAINTKQDSKIEIIIEQLHRNDIEQNRLLSMLENNVIQQKKSDDEFLKELKETKDKLKDIDTGVRGNREAIIIMNGKVTSYYNDKYEYLAFLR